MFLWNLLTLQKKEPKMLNSAPWRGKHKCWRDRNISLHCLNTDKFSWHCIKEVKKKITGGMRENLPYKTQATLPLHCIPLLTSIVRLVAVCRVIQDNSRLQMPNGDTVAACSWKNTKDLHQDVVGRKEILWPKDTFNAMDDPSLFISLGMWTLHKEITIQTVFPYIILTLISPHYGRTNPQRNFCSAPKLQTELASHIATAITWRFGCGGMGYSSIVLSIVTSCEIQAHSGLGLVFSPGLRWSLFYSVETLN